MDRNYSNIKFGKGLFQPQTKYSEDTKHLVKLLMEEAKVSMMQRRTIQRALENGEPLPQKLEHSTPTDKKKLKPRNRDHFHSALPARKKRSQDMIINSGAYEREQYRRTTPLMDIDMQKRRLAYLMAYGKEMPPTPRETPYYLKVRKEVKKDDYDPIEDLVRGIQERIDFLHDMECLGEGKKYRPIIREEIAQKVRLIEALDRGNSQVKQQIEKYKASERPLPKPFPLGELDE